MTQAPPPPMPSAPVRAPGPGLVVSLVVMGLGIAIGIASVIAIIVPLVGTFTSREYDVPGDFPLQMRLRHERYTVYERTGSQSGFDIGDRSRITIGPAQVRVVAPDGRRVGTFIHPDDETQTRGSDEYIGAVAFDVPRGGVYTVHVSSERPTQVLITRSLGDAVESVLIWFGTAFIGGLVLIGGIVMLAVGITRRSRTKRAALYAGWGQPPYPPYGPPPGPWQQPPG